MISKDQILPRLNIISRRIAASFSDLVILAALTGIAALAIAWLLVIIKGTPTDQQLQMVFHGVPKENLRYAWYEAIARGVAPYVMACLPLAWWIYESIFSLKKSPCTPGKRLFCLKTTSTKDRNARFGESALRSAMKVMTIMSMLFISSTTTLAFAAAFLLLVPMLSAKGQFLHDFIPGTNVVSKANWSVWFFRKQTEGN